MAVKSNINVISTIAVVFIIIISNHSLSRKYWIHKTTLYKTREDHGNRELVAMIVHWYSVVIQSNVLGILYGDSYL